MNIGIIIVAIMLVSAIGMVIAKVKLKKIRKEMANASENVEQPCIESCPEENA